MSKYLPKPTNSPRLGFTKSVEQNHSLVFGSVFDRSGKRVDLKILHVGFFKTLEQQYQAAHEWADEIIALAERMYVEQGCPL